MIFKSPYIKLSKFGLETYNKIWSDKSDLPLHDSVLLMDVIDFKEYYYRSKKKWHHKLIEKIFKVEIISRVL